MKFGSHFGSRFDGGMGNSSCCTDPQLAAAKATVGPQPTELPAQATDLGADSSPPVGSSEPAAAESQAGPVDSAPAAPPPAQPANKVIAVDLTKGGIRGRQERQAILQRTRSWLYRRRIL